MKIDINELKKPQSWAVIIPACLAIWALSATFNMTNSSGIADIQVNDARNTQKIALDLLARLKQSGSSGLGDSQLGQLV